MADPRAAMICTSTVVTFMGGLFVDSRLSRWISLICRLYTTAAAKLHGQSRDAERCQRAEPSEDLHTLAARPQFEPTPVPFSTSLACRGPEGTWNAPSPWSRHNGKSPLRPNNWLASEREVPSLERA